MIGRDARLSANFRVRELFPHGPLPDRTEQFLARALCTGALEPLREIAKAPVVVTDGRRLMLDHEDFAARGLKPSLTSDHAFGAGFLQGGDPGKVAVRAFPGPYFFGMGAADVLPMQDGAPRPWTRDEFEEAKRVLIDEPTQRVVGQLIYYPKRGHLHVSNAYTVLYSAAAILAMGLPAKRGPAYVYPE